jgi:oligopeptide transport system substrate-binding protein
MKTELRRGEEEKRRRGEKKPIHRASPLLLFSFFPLLFLAIFLAACSELKTPEAEPFYSETAPPQKKEFRWSNGKMPKSFDPAVASAPPETDVVRAIFEGLTDTNPKTLEAVPAVAVDWKSSDDAKTWTFHLRRDAKWSNGERLTANDFVRSWTRLAEMGETVSHYRLLKNIVGIELFKKEVSRPENNEPNIFPKPVTEPNFKFLERQNEPLEPQGLVPGPAEENDEAPELNKPAPKLGVEAVDNFTLKVSLVNADKNFPALVAHPMFRPIFGDGKDLETGKLNAAIVTSGAFRITSVGSDGITLDRSENFWNKDKIELERVKFMPAENAEKALEAYRKGDVDAVTNNDFEPLALKLLAPYNDFRRTTHSALNFYEFNQNKKPFDDRRVREALAIAIDRERLTEGETEGATRPALGFSPFEKEGETKLVQNAEEAKKLLADAGFAEGENFPTVKLVVNRNDLQQRIARGVAKMWKQNLNINTEIHVKDSIEFEAMRAAGDFDLIRRGAVFPTADETANMLAIFAHEAPPAPPVERSENGEADGETGKTENSGSKENPAETIENAAILTGEDAIAELPAIPLYFPTSYSLVKPYVQGFETNVLDAPSLKDIKIDNNWQPKKAE